MRTLLLLFVLWVVAIRGEEPGAAMHQKLRARIIESLPPARPATDPVETGRADETEGPVVVMEPFIVSESGPVRILAAAMARERQKREEERFSAVKGGTIYQRGRVEIGGWWSPTEGWKFLRLSW